MMLMMFNCYKTSFELQAGDLSSLPTSESLELRSLLSGGAAAARELRSHSSS